MTENVLLCKPWSVCQMHKPERGAEFCSLHVDEAALRTFTETYWKRMPQEAPEDYVYPAELPAYRCRVDPTTYQRVRNSGMGMWSTTIPRPTIEAVSLIPAKELTSLTEGMLMR